MENKIKINWKELFSRDNTVFHCETEELANRLLTIAHELGYKWCGGKRYDEHINWELYKDKTCYRIKVGTYGTLDFYISSDYDIIDINELLNIRTFKLKRNGK